MLHLIELYFSFRFHHFTDRKNEKYYLQDTHNILTSCQNEHDLTGVCNILSNAILKV